MCKIWAETFTTASEFAEFVNGKDFEIVKVIEFNGKLILLYKF